MGNGGVNSAHPKNRASQAFGVRSKPQRSGSRSNGAHSTAFATIPGANATAAA
jgi:hypothetical protein